MKMIKISRLLFFGLFMSCTLMAGCKKDKDDRKQYVGNYDVEEDFTETDSNGSTNSVDGYEYEIEISLSSISSDRILIENFGDYGETIEAIVSGNNFTIPSQTVSVNGGNISFDGSGKIIDGQSLDFSYSGNLGAVQITAKCKADKK